jgi:hypothetical protein
MKTIFTLLAGLLLSMAALAVPFNTPSMSQSVLTVRSQGQGDIRVVINGRLFDPKHNVMAISNLRPGQHKIKIYRQKTGRSFDFFGKRYELVFNRNMVVRPRTNVLITIDRFGQTSIRQQQLKRRNQVPVYGRDVQGRGNDRQLDRYDDIEDDFRSFEFDFDRGSRIDDFDDNIWYDNRNSRGMSDHEFSIVLQSIQKEWFEGNKVKSAQQVISSNYLTSLQVKQMLQLFTFENNKLDLAKQAYGKTIDQRMFLATVSSVFTFSSSKDELARYIRSY